MSEKTNCDPEICNCQSASSASQSVEQAKKELMRKASRWEWEASEVSAAVDALIAAVDASAYARGRADAGQEEKKI